MPPSLILADNLLLQFCKRVERLFGTSFVTPNMHMHGHFKDFVLDYGPIHEFWCYSFERYNGILGNQPSNNRAIEPQLLKQFLLDDVSSRFNFRDEFKNDFLSLDLNNAKKSALRGSVLDTITDDNEDMFLLPPKFKRCVISRNDADLVQQLFKKIYLNCSSVQINSIYKKYASVTLTL